MEKNNKGVPQNGWNEYSKLVLTELKRLHEDVEKIQDTLNETNERLVKQETLKHELLSIKKWKEEMTEVATPTTLKGMKDDISSLNTFKTVATTVWAVVQISFGVFIALFKG